MYEFGTIDKNGNVKHNTHRRKVISDTAYGLECFLAGEQLPKKWNRKGEVVEWEFLEDAYKKED